MGSRGRRRTISKSTLHRLYVEQEMSGRQIAAQLRCDKKVVYRELRRHGIPLRSKDSMWELVRARFLRRDEIAEAVLRDMYYDQEMSVEQIAEVVGHSPSSVIRRMDDLGMARRTTSEAGRIAMADQRVDIPRDELYEMYVEQGLSQEAIADHFGVSAFLIARRMQEYGIPVRPHPLATTVYPKTDFSGDAIEKEYLIGFRVGDLWVGRQNPSGATLSITCSSSKQAQIDLIESLFQDYGRVWIGQPDKDNMISVTALVNESFAFLLDKKGEIEKWILEDDACFWAFLAGYVDAEGNIGVYGGKAHLGLVSTDEQILFQIWEKLMAMGIPVARPRLRSVKGRPVLGTPRKGKTTKDQWGLATSRRDSLLYILERIWPHLKHADRKRRADAALANLRERMKSS